MITKSHGEAHSSCFMQMIWPPTSGLFVGQKVTPLNKGKRNGPIAPREDAVRMKQQYFAACHGPSPGLLRCDGAMGADGSSGVCMGRFLEKRWGHRGYVHPSQQQCLFLLCCVSPTLYLCNLAECGDVTLK